MNEIWIPTNNFEKILEENRLYIILESKVIFINEKEKISFYLDQISGVRLVKKRDFTANIMLLVSLSLLYVYVLSPMNSISNFLKLIFIVTAVIVACRIKKHSHKILINTANYGFNEILISEKNLSFARIFISKFSIDSKTAIKLEKESQC
jgi:hypothetical protein